MVRSWLELTDNPDSYMLLMDNGPDGLPDPATEVRVPLHRGARFVVDTQRLWHVVVHNGDAPRYALITSFESAARSTLDRRQLAGLTLVHAVPRPPVTTATRRGVDRRASPSVSRPVARAARSADQLGHLAHDLGQLEVLRRVDGGDAGGEQRRADRPRG